MKDKKNRLISIYLFAIAVLLCGTANAVMIQPTGAVANQVAYAGATEPTNLIDPTQTSGTQLYMPAWADVYLSGAWGTEHHWVYIDLGSTYDLDTIRLWNYMHQETVADVSGRGSKNISIHVGGTGAVLPPTTTPVGTNDTDSLPNAFLGTGWTKIFDSNTNGDLSRGPNTTTSVAGTLTNASLVFDASGNNGVRYIGIDIDSRWAADPYTTNMVGLSYVQVEGTMTGTDPDNKATDPYPPDNAAGVPLNQVLSWTEPNGFTPSGYDVYFDANEALVTSGDASVRVATNQSGTSYTPTLLYDTEYFWRVDPRDGATAYEGDLWSLTSSVQPPETMRGTVTKIGTNETRTLYLEKYSCRGDNFELVLLGTDGVTQTTIEPGPVRTYRGWCEEEPDSYVEARLLTNGDLRYRVFKANDLDWDWSYDPPAENTEYAAAVNNFTVIGGTPVDPSGQPLTGASFVSPAALLNSYYKTAYQADVGFDLTVEYTGSFNYSDPATYGRKAENAIMHMNGISIRDMLAEHQLGKVVIRQSQAGLDYDNAQWGLQWPSINAYWETLFPTVDHHFLAFVGSVGGGVAFVCDYGGTNWGARSFNGFTGDGNWWHVWRHETGHNWGAYDCMEGCPGPDGSTINSGNSITTSRFSNPEITYIMSCRAGKWPVLRNLGSYDYPIPPYANLDRTQTYIEEPIFLDVLGNDYDANNDTIAISSFDTKSSLGGTIEFSSGSGPDGRDELVYFPPVAEGTDTFRYSIVDSTGRTGWGNVRISLQQENLKLYWPLDDGSGEIVSDASGYGRTGTLTSMDPGTDWISGKFDGGLNFNGVDDQVQGPTSIPDGGSMTVSAWVNFDASGSNTFRRAVSKGYYANGWQLGLAQYSAGTYVTDGAEFSLMEDLGTIRTIGGTTSLTAGTWNHLVGVYDIDADMMYLYVNGTLENNMSISSTSVGIKANTDPFRIGVDAGALYFPGSIDEVRYYNYALDQAGVDALYAGGRAENPSPIDMADGVTIGKNLSWLPGASAVEHDVYIGTDYDTVLNATIASDEYRGRQSGTVYDPNLNCGARYYWRIDEVLADESVIPGVVWEFTTGTLITPLVYDVSSENVLGMNRDADHTVDGSGLTGAGSAGSTHVVGEDPGYVWTTYGIYNATDYDPYITYDLGEVCDVKTIRHWGYNAVTNSYLAPDEVDVYTSTNGRDFTFQETLYFEEAPALSTYTGQDITVDYRNVRYIKFDIMTNHDGATFDGTGSDGGDVDGRSLTGLSEIRFEGKPNMYDGSRGMDDLIGFAGHWLDSNCYDLPRCGGADLDGDRDVDLLDFARFASNWLGGL